MEFANAVVYVIALGVAAALFAKWCNGRKRNSSVDETVDAIVNHIYNTYPGFFELGVGRYFRTKGTIELNVRDLPLMKKAFAKHSVFLVDAGPQAAVDQFHMELEYAGNTIGVKAYRNIN